MTPSYGRGFAAALALGFIWNASAFADPVPSFDQVRAAAEQEGKVVVYVQSPSRPETATALGTAFNARFNTHIKLQWVVAPAPATTTRAIAEEAGGHVSIDVIGVGAAEEVATATKAGLLKPYPWSEVFGATLPAIPKLEALMIPAFKGDALPYIVAAYGLAWNPEQITEDELPNKLTDLTDPKWKSRFGINSFFLGPVDITNYSLGKPQTLDLAKQIIANGPVYEHGGAAVANAVATGEVPVGITAVPIAENEIRKKKPIKYKLFADVIPLSQLHLYVPENSPDPNAARLFTAWLVSEGVAIANQYEPLYSPADPTNAQAKLIADQVKKTGAKISAPTTPQDLTDTQDLRQQIVLLLTGQSN